MSATALLTASQAPPRIRTFIQTADGSWRTSVKGPDGKDVEWVYVPPTKFAGTVSTRLAVVDAAAAKRSCTNTASTIWPSRAGGLA